MNTLGLQLIEQWYQLDYDALRTRFGLDDGARWRVQTPLRDSPVCRAGLWCGTRDLKHIARNAVICGGVCITDCMPSLTLECVAKIHGLLTTAKLIDAMPILFVGTRGEKLKFPSLSADWDDVHRQVSKMAARFAERLQLASYHVCNTDAFKDAPAVTHACSVIQSRVPRDTLINLYEIARNPRAPALGTAGQVAATIDCVAFNCVSVLAAIYERDIGQLIYFEDLQQIQVVQCAQQVDSEVLGGPSTATAGIYFCPFPNVRGDGRMYRSSQPDKIYVGDSLAKLTYQYASMPAALLDLWRQCFADEHGECDWRTPKDFAKFTRGLIQ